MDKTPKNYFLNQRAWTLAVIVSMIAISNWGQGISWQFSTLTAYSLFPLFGLLAFSLMWTHYIIGALRRKMAVDKSVTKDYFALTGWIVLLLICLHPGLLWFQLWRDGFGFPPSSYLNNYVAPTLKWAAMLGTASLLMFLAFEFKRWFGKKKWWVAIEYANVAAMFAILVHSLKLGTNLQSGPLRFMWLFYGLTLGISVIYIYTGKHSDKITKSKGNQ